MASRPDRLTAKKRDLFCLSLADPRTGPDAVQKLADPVANRTSKCKDV
jgi:hypothetical protein